MRFVLVHGGFHGAWCWERTIPELERLGHAAIAIDLPGNGTRADEEPTLADRRDAVLAVLQPGDVLVGHSGGGYEITLAADAAPDKVGHLVYLAAALPLEGQPIIAASGGAPRGTDAQGRPVTQLMEDDGNGMMRFVRPDTRGNMEICDDALAADFFYHDCDAQTVAWACARLTPAPARFIQEPVHLARFWQANLPRSYVQCLQDRAMPIGFAERVAARLGVEPLAIDASHSPFLSRPAELAAQLVKATTTRPTGPLLRS